MLIFVVLLISGWGIYRNDLSFSPLLCSLLFWINKGPGDKITLERSGMDGMKQESLVVLTAQVPRSLTLDVTARRLYWMSDFKKVHDSYVQL
jgi:hypothetical protein